MTAEGGATALKIHGYKFEYIIYCSSDDISEVLIFASRTNSRIQESCEKYYYYSDTEENLKCKNSKLREKLQIKYSRKFKHAKITKSTVCIDNENLKKHIAAASEHTVQ